MSEWMDICEDRIRHKRLRKSKDKCNNNNNMKIGIRSSLFVIVQLATTISVIIKSPPATAFAFIPCTFRNDLVSNYQSLESTTTQNLHHGHENGLVHWRRQSSSLTDWVVENLEANSSSDSNVTSITTASITKAGENDTLPIQGLVIGDDHQVKFQILAANAPSTSIQDENSSTIHEIRLLVGRNGWGTGVHPTTRLCLEWLLFLHNDNSDAIQNKVVVDYGCGSGILSIAALHLGAQKCIGVDVEAEALITAERNVQLNNLTDFSGLHTRQVLPYELCGQGGADIIIANILVGQLVRPSMVAVLVTNLAPQGLLCLSGIRPGSQVDSLKQAYGHAIEWLDDQYAELDAKDTQGSLDSYGFDCGEWVRLVGRKKASWSSRDEIEYMSELAVS